MSFTHAQRARREHKQRVQSIFCSLSRSLGYDGPDGAEEGKAMWARAVELAELELHELEEETP